MLKIKELRNKLILPFAVKKKSHSKEISSEWLFFTIVFFGKFESFLLFPMRFDIRISA